MPQGIKGRSEPSAQAGGFYLIDGQYDATHGAQSVREGDSMDHKILGEIMHNTRVKTYPDGTQVVTVADRPIFREPGWELADKWEAERRGPNAEREGKAEDLERARRRARAAVADLGRANRFKYFVTLTLDASKIDRHDVGITGRELRRWLSHQVQRRGLAYVLVPERHKDGALHFHGLINDALDMMDSGTVKKVDGGKPRKPRSMAEKCRWLEDGGQVVYNIPGWRYGFSTALELRGDYRKAVAYVCKYIGKDSEKIGGRWYFSGGDLAKPEKSYSDTDFEAMRTECAGHEYRIERLGVRCMNIDTEE